MSIKTWRENWNYAEGQSTTQQERLMQAEIDELRAENASLRKEKDERPILDAILLRAGKLKWEEQEIARLQAELGHTKTLLGSAEMQISELRAKVSVRDAEMDKLKKQPPDAWTAQCTKTKRFNYIWHEEDDAKGWINLQHQSSDTGTWRGPIAVYITAGAQPKAELTDLSFESLLSQYWDIAYSEGSTGVSRGTEAQEVLSGLRAVQAAQKSK